MDKITAKKIHDRLEQQYNEEANKKHPDKKKLSRLNKIIDDMKKYV